MFDLGVVLGIAAVLLLAPMVIRGAPYLPSLRSTIEKMVRAAEIKPGMRTMDLGAGDGRIVIAMAQAGAEAHGYEISPILVLWGKYKIWRLGLRGRAFMHWGSFWSKEMSGYGVVTIFGIQHIMDRLEVKLKRELKSGAKVISNIFQFSTWEAQEDSPIYIYRKKTRRCSNALAENLAPFTSAGR